MLVLVGWPEPAGQSARCDNRPLAFPESLDQTGISKNAEMARPQIRHRLDTDQNLYLALNLNTRAAGIGFADAASMPPDDNGLL